MIKRIFFCQFIKNPYSQKYIKIRDFFCNIFLEQYSDTKNFCSKKYKKNIFKSF